MPLIVREIDGGASFGRDLALRLSRGEGRAATVAPPDPDDVDWSADRARERVRPRPPRRADAGRPATERSTVHIHDPARDRGDPPAAGRADPRQRARTAGRSRRPPGPTSATTSAARSPSVYERDDAPRRRRRALLLRAPDYFDAVLGLRAQLAGRPAARAEAQVGAAAIAAVSDGLLHYFLGGTADGARSALAVQERGRGDARPRRRARRCRSTSAAASQPGDGLERFKRGFANAEPPLPHPRVVCDPSAYDRSRPAAPRDRRDRRPGFPPTGRPDRPPIERPRAHVGRDTRCRRSAPDRCARRAPTPRTRRRSAPGPWSPQLRERSAASASPGQAVRPTVPWPMTRLSADLAARG